MDRRRSDRTVRRVPVRFWPRAEPDRPRKGYSTNISAGGMFVTTASPARSGERLRLEVGEEGQAFAVEGCVAHSRRLAPELRKLGHAGMGVRFLTAQELVEELIGRAGAPKAQAGEFEEAAVGEGHYRLRFASPEELLRVYRKDVVHGGLFVPTRKPAALRARIALEIELGVAELAPARLAAQVVHRIEPSGEGAGPNLVAGMGVHFEDPAAARAAFAPAVEALERSAPSGEG
jgi:Tfp pilus assembly protein PilZ